MKHVSELHELHELWTQSEGDAIKTEKLTRSLMKQLEQNKTALTERQLKVLKETLNVLKFRINIDSSMEDNRQIICQLHFTGRYDYLLQQIKHWSMYRYAAYGHPYITTIHDDMRQKGMIDIDKVLDVLYYIDELRRFKWTYHEYQTREHYDQFLLATMWFRKHDIRIENDEYFIFSTSNSLRHSLRLKDFWQLQSEKYKHLSDLVSEIAAEGGEGDMTKEALLEYIGSLYANEDDPFFMSLWNKLGDEHDANEIKKRIYNRWNLDVGGATIANSDILIPLLYRDNSSYFGIADCEKIAQCKNNILMGQDILPEIQQIGDFFQ